VQSLVVRSCIRPRIMNAISLGLRAKYYYGTIQTDIAGSIQMTSVAAGVFVGRLASCSDKRPAAIQIS
jgi:hypothetical protein